MKKLRRFLAIEPYPSNWGDAIAKWRAVKTFRQQNPDIIVYSMLHEKTARSAAPLLLYEGLLDNVCSIPKDICGRAYPLIEFTREHLGELPLDGVILGEVFTEDNDYVLNVLFRDVDFYTLPISMSYKSITAKRLETSDWRAWTIEESIRPLLESLSSKPSIAFFPSSSRLHGAIHSEGFDLIVSALRDKYNIILLGDEKGYYNYLVEGWKRTKYPEALVRETSLYIGECFDWMGLSPLKQMEIAKHCKFAIATSTGAFVIPILLDMPYIQIQGGDFQVDWQAEKATRYEIVPCNCDVYPCANYRKRACAQLPYCLNEGINIEGLLGAIERIERVLT